MTDVRVRPEGPEDAAAIRAVVAEAFAVDDGRTPGEPGLVDALRGTDAWRPELSVVAERDGKVVAHVLLSRVDVAGRPALALGPVAVRPADQGQGLGSAVICAALETAKAAGERLVVLLGAPAYYGRFGFVPADSYGLTSVWGGGSAWQALAWGAVEPGEVVFPPPWHAL